MVQKPLNHRGRPGGDDSELRHKSGLCRAQARVASLRRRGRFPQRRPARHRLRRPRQAGIVFSWPGDCRGVAAGFSPAVHPLPHKETSHESQTIEPPRVPEDHDRPGRRRDRRSVFLDKCRDAGPPRPTTGWASARSASAAAAAGSATTPAAAGTCWPARTSIASGPRSSRRSTTASAKSTATTARCWTARTWTW